MHKDKASPIRHFYLCTSEVKKVEVEEEEDDEMRVYGCHRLSGWQYIWAG